MFRPPTGIECHPPERVAADAAERGKVIATDFVPIVFQFAVAEGEFIVGIPARTAQ